MLGGGRLWLTKIRCLEKSVKSVFVLSTHTFHKNVCFTVCLNSAVFFDSAMVNLWLLSVKYC